VRSQRKDAPSTQYLTGASPVPTPMIVSGKARGRPRGSRLITGVGSMTPAVATMHSVGMEGVQDGCSAPGRLLA
jgi:hypothetical protein